MENGNCKNSNGKLVPKKGELWCVVWVWVGKLQVVCWTTLSKVKWKSAQMRRLCELPDFGASWVQFCSICTSQMSPLIYVETKRNNTTCSMNHALNWRNNPKHIQYLVWQSILKLCSNSNKMSVNQGACQGALLLNIFCLSLRHLNVSSEDASDLFRSNLPTQPASSDKIQEIWWPKRLSGGFIFLGPELLTWDGGLISANLRPNMMPTIYHHWIKILYIYIYHLIQCWQVFQWTRLWLALGKFNPHMCRRCWFLPTGGSRRNRISDGTTCVYIIWHFCRVKAHLVGIKTAGNNVTKVLVPFQALPKKSQQVAWPP